MTVLLLGCLHKPPAEVLPDEHVGAFKIEAFGQTFAGVGVFAEDEDDLVFQALTPAGTALFTVRADRESTTVQAPDPEMTALLERLPWYRDIALVTRWRCAEAVCSTETGTLRSTGDRWTYRGDGGKATVQYGEWIVVNDPRRRYTLTVAP